MTDPSPGPTRRHLLVSGALAAAGALAGCVGSSGDGGDGASGDRLALPTLDVGRSPGGEVVVEPPGEVTLLDFFATWCAPCKPQMSNLRTIRERFPGVHMLSITNESDRAAVRSFWREYDGTWPVALDTDLDASTRYDATRVPTLLALDPEGGEVWRHSGLAATDSIAAALRDAGATEQ